MQKLIFTAAAFVMISLLAACKDSTGGQSTPIDSTVQSGTAPVRTTAGSPVTTTDTSISARDAYHKDTPGNRAGMTQPNGNRTNTSNTTDKTTTTGSANNGDADGGRKK